MFRRREDGSEELINDNNASESASASNNSSTSAPASPAAAAATPATPASAPAAQPAQSFRPMPPQAAMVAASRNSMSPAPAATPAATPASEPSRSVASPLSKPTAKRVLTVGPDIQMKGEITTCDRVVIEGLVDATMRDVHTVELTESGSLKGTAEVEDAEISGSFEGDITVRGKLTIYASGRVRGNITYGEIEIQRGGQISGNIRNAADAKTGNNPLHKKAA